MRSWSPELAREVAAMPTDPAPEATWLQVDVPRLLEQLEAEFGEDDDARVLRALIERVEVSASASDGDVAEAR
jgi:hypothetical protein